MQGGLLAGAPRGSVWGMLKGSIEVDPGLAPLLKRMGRTLTKKSQARTILNRTTKRFMLPLAQAIRAGAPRRTGQLRKSTRRVQGWGRRGRWGAAVGSDFAKNNPPGVAVAKGERRGLKKVLAVAYGTRHMRGRDYIGRAWAAQRPTARAFARALEEELDRFIVENAAKSLKARKGRR